MIEDSKYIGTYKRSKYKLENKRRDIRCRYYERRKVGAGNLSAVVLPPTFCALGGMSGGGMSAK